MRICRECKKPNLKIIGTSEFGDTIEVECSACGAYYEVEPDGLDEGGMEWVEAKMNDEACFASTKEIERLKEENIQLRLQLKIMEDIISKYKDGVK